MIAAVTALTALTASAQNAADAQFAVKATADIGFGSALSIDNALTGNRDTKSSSSGFGVDFGWTFWKKGVHSLEANIGLGYASTSVTADHGTMSYHYSASADADMDMDTYIRYYNINDMHQKISAGRVTIPIYLNYKYEINPRITAHALLGLKLGVGASSKVSKATASLFSYGIYPQYDNLMIDASYMNEFGDAVLGAAQTLKPETSASTSLLTGLGAEIAVWGPLAADISIRYESGFGNMFKSVEMTGTTFTADNAPVTYTVADGQKMRPLTSYFTKSKISRLSCAISLLYRF